MFWRLDLLRSESHRERVAFETVRAHVIILSLHGNEALPIEVEEWWSSWLKQKENRPYALGIFLDPSAITPARPNPVIAYMRQIAALGDADLFCSFSESSGTGVEEADAGGFRSVSPLTPVPWGIPLALKHPHAGA